MNKVSIALLRCEKYEQAQFEYLRSHYQHLKYMDWMKYLRIPYSKGKNMSTSKRVSILLLEHWKKKKSF